MYTLNANGTDYDAEELVDPIVCAACGSHNVAQEVDADDPFNPTVFYVTVFCDDCDYVEEREEGA